MRHQLLVTVFFAWVSAATAVRADNSDFEDRVRSFILENPEVIIEALNILAEREAREATIAQLENFGELFTDVPKLGEGDPNAEMRVVEFFDYKCVPCKAVHPQIVEFVEAHPNVRVEMRHLPILTPGSERAARFALATEAEYGSETYRAVHDQLWQLRGPLNSVGFQRVAASLGLDYARIEAAMKDPKIDGRINYNRDAAIALEIFGTPAFVTPSSVAFGSTDIEALAKVWLSQ